MSITWYGKLPERWEMRTIKSLFHIQKSIAGEEGYDVLSITQKGIKIKDIDSNQGQMAQSYAKYQFVNVGDFAMNHMDLLTGWVDRSKIFGVTSPDYRVFVLDDTMQNPDYLLRILQLCYSQRVFYAFGRGAASEGRWRLPRKEFMDFSFPIPPQIEQDQIVRYLDWKLSQVNKLINAKRQQVGLLREHIDVLANHAVENPQSKIRLKHMTENVRSFIERDNAYVYSPIGVLNRGRGIFHKKQLKGDELGSSEFFSVEPNTLMFSGQFAWEGAVAITSEKERNCIASHRYYTIKGLDNICKTEYLWAFFQTKLGDLILNNCSHGAAGRNKPLNFNELLNEYISLPSIDIQRMIASHVRNYMKYRELIKIYEAYILEYRTRLISDVVTGKLDVRGVAVPQYEAVEETADDVAEDEEINEETEGEE